MVLSSRIDVVGLVVQQQRGLFEAGARATIKHERAKVANSSGVVCAMCSSKQGKNVRF